MLDVKFIAQNPDVVRATIKNKNEKRNDIDEICALYEKRKSGQTEIDRLRKEVNDLSKQFALAKKEGREEPELMKRSRAAGDQAKKLEGEQRETEAKLKELLAWVPNVPADDGPVGKDASANKVVREWGEKRKFSFPPRPHWEIGSDLGIVDFERAPKISASNFLPLKGVGARLERGLINFMLDIHTKEHGYTEIWPPYLSGRAFLPPS